MLVQPGRQQPALNADRVAQCRPYALPGRRQLAWRRPPELEVVPVLEAAGWGLGAGSALVLGALVAWFVPVPQTVIAGIMAFGAGVLVSALAFDLVGEAEQQGGLAATSVGFGVGTLLDGIPESVVLGTSLIAGGGVGLVLVAVFLSNVPEGLSSAAGMRKAGRSARYVFGV